MHSNGQVGFASCSPGGSLRIGRLPDDTPVTLAELHAIAASLDAAQARKYPTVIATDSKSAIQILQQRGKHLYPEITQRIWNRARELSKSQPIPKLLWIPSHVGIDGNEQADSAAFDAANLSAEFLMPAELTTASALRPVDSFALTKHQLQCASSHKVAWYLASTPDRITSLPTEVEVTLRRLRMDVKPLHMLTGSRTCPHCEESSWTPVHYLVSCPTQPVLRQELRQLLRPEEHGLDDYHTAAAILRTAVERWPDPLLDLLAVQPPWGEDP